MSMGCVLSSVLSLAHMLCPSAFATLLVSVRYVRSGSFSRASEKMLAQSTVRFSPRRCVPLMCVASTVCVCSKERVSSFWV